MTQLRRMARFPRMTRFAMVESGGSAALVGSGADGQKMSRRPLDTKHLKSTAVLGAALLVTALLAYHPGVAQALKGDRL